jgi:hypothetical protein
MAASYFWQSDSFQRFALPKYVGFGKIGSTAAIVNSLFKMGSHGLEDRYPA